MKMKGLTHPVTKVEPRILFLLVSQEVLVCSLIAESSKWLPFCLSIAVFNLHSQPLSLYHQLNKNEECHFVFICYQRYFILHFHHYFHVCLHLMFHFVANTELVMPLLYAAISFIEFIVEICFVKSNMCVLLQRLQMLFSKSLQS